MAGTHTKALPWWSVAIPGVSAIVLAATWGRGNARVVMLAIVSIALISAVLAAVHHAEVVALRVGEPFGTLILALAVTVIEAGLILMLMTGPKGSPTLARDTVYSAYMVVCNGVVGLCLLVGGLKHHVLRFRVDGVNAAVATLTAVATLALVLPTFTTSTPVGSYSSSQLAFAGVGSLTLYGVFVFVQTKRHRNYFLPPPVTASAGAGPGTVGAGPSTVGASPATAGASPGTVGASPGTVGSEADGEDDESGPPAPPPTERETLISLGLMLVCLIAVVGLAKTASTAIERAVTAAGLPEAVVGVCIALLVLLPETGAAIRAAARNRVQTSLNLAYGSSLASIGLTIPAIAVRRHNSVAWVGASRHAGRS